MALDGNCWVCAIWLLHSTVAGLASSPFLFQDQNGQVTVECGNHFAHTQQFLSNAILTLLATGLSLAATSLETSRRSGWGKNGPISASRFRYNATDRRREGERYSTQRGVLGLGCVNPTNWVTQPRLHLLAESVRKGGGRLPWN